MDVRNLGLYAALSILMLGSTTGCANLNSIFRKTETESGKTEVILIDDKQRPVTVNHMKSDSPMTCVARSADALSAAAASANLKISQASGAGGEAGFASAEQVSSIAFRTQVTEAQQEFLYTLCQLRANGVLSDVDVSDNLRHFQNTMLAMVAIDDMATSARPKPASDTGSPSGETTPPSSPDAPDPKVQAVKAAQSGADNAKNAVTAASKKVGSAAKAVDGITDVKDVKSKTDDMTSALKTYDDKQKKYAQALTKLSDAVKAVKGKDVKAPDDVTSDSSDSAAALKDVPTDYKNVTDAVAALAKVTDNTKLKPAQAQVDTTLQTYTDALSKYETSQDAFGKALTAWNAADDPKKGKTSPKPGNTSGADASAAALSATVANDVAIIVQTIVWQSFMTEQCQKALFVNYKTTEPIVRQFCLDHLKRADDIRERQLLGTLTVSTSGPRTPAEAPIVPPPNFTPVVSVPLQPPYLYIDQALIDKSVENVLKENATPPASDAVPPAAPAK